MATLQRGFAALCDGHIAFDPRLFPAVREDPERAATLLGTTTLPPTIEVLVWCYLVEMETLSGLGLIDTGRGSFLGGKPGTLEDQLRDHGAEPADITQIWLTHLHGDHCGGLITASGDPVFPNARIALAAAEARFWFDPALPEPRRPVAMDAQRALAPYGDRIDSIEPGTLVAGGLAVSAFGHTAGHMAWLFEEAKLMAAGDVVHVPAFQEVEPDWSTDWDHDPVMAASTRKTLADRARRDGLTLLTGHAGPIEYKRL